ncbi:MAG: XdhC family protein, partial [Candidatus Hodarchaeales archaeon]
MKDFINIINDHIGRGVPLALVTVVEVRGSAPQRIGAKMLISNEGRRLWGTTGGGKIEELAKKQAMIQLNLGQPLLKEYELVEEGTNATGMICGGKMTLFFDIFGAGAKVYIFGAGHIAQQLYPLLNKLGFSTVIIDNRAEYMKESFPDVIDSNLISGTLPDIVEDMYFSPHSYIIIMTYTHELDEKIIKHLLLNKIQEIDKINYLGMIGSRRKVEEIFSRLTAAGIKPDILNRV